MVKFSFYTIIFGLIIAAFMFLGSNIAIPFAGLILVFMVLISYLKRHAVAVEEHDFRSQSLSQKLNQQSAVRTKQKRTIPADPKVLAVFKKRLNSPPPVINAADNPIKIADKEDKKHFDLVLQKNSNQQYKQDAEKEKVFVSISNKAREKYLDNPVSKQKNDSSVATDAATEPIEAVEDKPADSKPQTKIEPVAKVTKKAKSPKTEIKSIFDDLINEDSIINAQLPNLLAENAISEQSNNPSNTPLIEEIITAKPSSKNAANRPLVENLPRASQKIVDKAKLLINSGDFDKAQSEIKDFQENNDLPLSETENGEIMFLNSLIAVNTENPKQAREMLIDYFSNHINEENSAFEDRLNEICANFRGLNYQKHALPFFITMLSRKRDQKDFAAMDSLYHDIVCAYKQLDEPEKLIESYQNQLAIKKNLKDFDGQLHVLDELGKIYFEKNDRIGMNFCYQKSMEVKKDMLNDARES